MSKIKIPAPTPVNLPDLPVTTSLPIPNIPLILTPLIPEYDGDINAVPPSWLDKFRGIFAIVVVFIEQATTAAEVIYGPGTGAAKKSFVTNKTMEYIKALEDKLNFIPGWLQPIAFKAISMALDFIIEKIVKNFKIKGIL